MTDKKSNSLSYPKGFRRYSELLGKDNSPTVLVALSGGADSVTLFDLTARLCEEEGGCFYACHVNHGIRGDEAIRDRDFCIALAKSCKFCKEIFVLNTDVPAIAAESGESLESAARRVRYEFFESVMEDNKIDLLATAHNADDNLETLIFNLVRGSGAKGMRGIPPIRELPSGRRVVRPILEMTKTEILLYCEERGLKFVTDSTNADVEYSRNLIRNEVVPLLERLNPALREHATELSGDMREVYSLVETESDKYLTANGSVLANAFDGMPPAAYHETLSRAIERSGFECELERVHVESLVSLAKKGVEYSSVSLPNGIAGKIKDGKLIFEHESREKKPRADYEIKVKPGENVLPDGSRLLFLDPDDTVKENVYKFSTNARLDFDKINLTAKNRREGDRIKVKGVRKSIKKLMCDQKLDRALRDRIPVISDGDIPICVPSVAVCDEIFTKNEGNCLIVWLPDGKDV